MELTQCKFIQYFLFKSGLQDFCKTLSILDLYLCTHTENPTSQQYQHKFSFAFIPHHTLWWLNIYRKLPLIRLLKNSSNGFVVVVSVHPTGVIWSSNGFKSLGIKLSPSVWFCNQNHIVPFYFPGYVLFFLKFNFISTVYMVPKLNLQNKYMQGTLPYISVPQSYSLLPLWEVINFFTVNPAF